MPTTTFNYGDWSFWRPYFPPDGYYGESKIAFDGPNRRILIAEGETLISVKSQIYSVWKRWVQVPGSDNARWPQAISAVGGDPITTTEFLGATFFLENGWRIQPAPGNYILSIEGNLYTREINGNPVISTPGVAVSLVRANLVDGRIAITQEDYEAIADEVWDELRYEHTGEGSFGEGVQSVRGDIYGNVLFDVQGNIDGAVRGDVLGDIQGDVLGPTNLVNNIWDKVLDSGSHNVDGSAGKRLWTLQDYGGYEAGSVWIDTLDGTNGVVSDINGTVGLPVSNITAAYTIAENNRINQFFVNQNSNIDLTGFSSDLTQYRFWGNKWSVNLGGINIDKIIFENCHVNGAGTTSVSGAQFNKAILDDVTIGPSEFHGCYFIDNFTVGSAGEYIFDQCFSASAGETAINFDMGSGVGATEVTFTHWSGNVQINNMSTGDVVTIEGTGNVIVDASSNGGNLSIRGTISVTDNSAGAVTVTSDAVIDQQRISDAVWDQVLNVGTYNDVDSAGRRLRELQDSDVPALQGTVDGVEAKVDTIDTVVDSIQIDTDSIETKVDTIDAVVDAIEVDTTSIETKVDTANTNINTIDTVVDSIQVDTNNIETKVDTANANITNIDGDIATVDTKVTQLGTDVSNIDTNVTNVQNTTNTINSRVTTIDNIVDQIKQINTGRWKIDRVTSVLTIYDTNGTTPLFQFDLKDDTGAANPDTVYERVPI
jgi:outer membrane murein-binding lipoprotein Lpp